MRQLLYTVFITNNHVSFYLRWKEHIKNSQNIMTMFVCKILFYILCLHYQLHFKKTLRFEWEFSLSF